MPETWYMIAAVAIAGIITVLLRALPFAILKPLRKSKFVQSLGRWMPAGLLLILAVVMVTGEAMSRPDKLWILGIATATTVLVHVFLGRRALLSIFLGTAVYVTLLNLF
jgi:branched-subunit amino acid transport protein AzlD